MSTKILCPKHAEKTPSCVLYPDGGYKCFGCGAFGNIAELNVDQALVPKAKPPEDIEARLKYIRKLPRQDYRKLYLPYDLTGIYIVYPNEEYYVKRNYSYDTSSVKYVYPTGHKKPLFVVDNGCKHNRFSLLFIVEGQLNALSLDCAVNTLGAIVSPGSANDLCKPENFDMYITYDNIAIFVDYDTAGMQNGRKLQKLLMQAGKNVVLCPLENDFNKLLVTYGKKPIHQETKSALEMLGM